MKKDRKKGPHFSHKKKTGIPNIISPMEIKDKTIFLVIQTGFGARYLLQTDIFKTLKKSRARIVILIPNADEDHFRCEFEDTNVFIEKLETDQTMAYLQNSKLQKFLKNARSFTLNPTFAPLTTIESEYKIYKDDISPTWKSKIALAILDLTIKTLRRFKWLRRFLIWLESRLFVVHSHKALFEKYKPDMVITTGLGYWYPDVFIMREARFHKAMVISIILSWDNPSSKGMAGAKPDHVVAWTDAMKQELIEYHDIDPNSIFVGGVAHFDLYYKKEVLLTKEELCERLNLDPTNKILILATKSPNSFPWNADIAGLIAEEIANNNFDIPCQLIVRMHPITFLSKNGRPLFKDLLREYDNLKNRYPFVSFSRPNIRSQQLEFDMPWSDMIELGSILKNADVLINMFSTVAIEASIFDLPIIHVGFEGDPAKRTKARQSIKIDEIQTHNQRVIQTDGVKIAHNKEELIRLINIYLHDRTLDSEQRGVIKKQECGLHSGKVGHTIGTHLIRLLQDKCGGCSR